MYDMADMYMVIVATVVITWSLTTMIRTGKEKQK